MRSVSVGRSVFHDYEPGDSIFEVDRLTSKGFTAELAQGGDRVGVQRLFGGPGSDEDVDFSDIWTPDKKADFKGLSKALKFLKFSPSEAETLFNVIGASVNIAVGIVSVVGAIGGALDLMKKLGILGPDKDPVQEALKQIGERVEAIYSYLANEEKRGRYNDALLWRITADKADNALANLAISRSRENLEALIPHASDLDGALLEMLDAGRAKIAFLRGPYTDEHGNASWLDYAQSPYMATAAGGPINYRDASQELKAEIWDPGHYVDVLVRSLQERLAVATAIEPAFRSTGYDREALKKIADGVLAFAQAWRGAILVADPVFALNAGGTLRSPTMDAPPGVPIGAVDPVTGISSLNPQWSGFDIEFKRSHFPGAAWGGVWDEARAVDPAKALVAVAAAHAEAVDQVVRLCGVEKLMALQRAMRSIASPPNGSDFVRLPDATFRRPLAQMVTGTVGSRQNVGNGTPEQVDLGGLKTFSPDPNKTYDGTRYHQHGYKQFSFRMARRAEWSRVRLGYALRIGSETIPLMEFALATDPSAGDFPDKTIERVIEMQTTVYDCYQTGHLRAADEDRFERDGTISGGERVLANSRPGQAKIRVTVEFEQFADGVAGGYAGTATVSVATLEPEQFRDASILGVTVFETHVGADRAPSEVVADSMTVHLVPTYVVLGADFFADYHAAEKAVEDMIKGVDERFLEQQLQVGPPDPDPKWRIRSRVEHIERRVGYVHALIDTGEANVIEHIASYLAPVVER